MKKLLNREVWAMIGLIAVFIAVSVWVRTSMEPIRQIIAGSHVFGIIAYILINIIEVLVAPISVLPLMPLAVAAWGSLATALMCIGAWTTGGMIAFLLARRFGQPLALRFVKPEYLRRIERALPERHLWWMVVILRLALPFDILSYAMGLFPVIKPQHYLAATFIGAVPFAFLYAYSVTLPLGYQVGLIAAAMGLVIWMLKRARLF